MIYSVSPFLLIGIILAQATLPPTTGNFFYGDISAGGNGAFNSPEFHSSSWLVSDKKWNFTLALNTDEYFTSLVGAECVHNCIVPEDRKYDPKDSGSGWPDAFASGEQWTVNYLYHQQFQGTSTLRGAAYHE